jgi:hypothetical protein
MTAFPNSALIGAIDVRSSARSTTVANTMLS